MPNTDLKIGSLLRIKEYCRKNVTIRENGEFIELVTIFANENNITYEIEATLIDPESNDEFFATTDYC